MSNAKPTFPGIQGSHASSERPQVVLYAKPNCPLCDEALEEIHSAQRQVAFDLVEVNILDDFVLYEKYKHAIPVVTVSGIEAFRYRLSAQALVDRIRNE